MIVYLDLDRTTFKTDQADEILTTVAELYPELEASQLLRDKEHYCKTVGDMYYWDFGEQLESYGLDADEVFTELAHSELADGRLEYEGLGELVASLTQTGVEVKVLTFGADKYQRLKASLCPSLRGLEILTTLHDKATVLEAAEEECWLVDDKPIGDELPGNVSFVQVSLEGKPVDEDAYWPVLYSLREVQEFFTDVLH